MRRVLLVLSILAVTTGISHAAPGGPVTVSCPRLPQAPAIDGVPGGDEWSKAAAVGPFVLDNGGVPSLATEAYVGFDDEALYLAVRLHDPAPAELRCAATERDGAVQADDSLIVILDPGQDGTDIIQLAVNAAGTEYDAVDGDAAASVNWQSAVSRDDTGWMVEIAYRFGDAGAPQPGTRWGLDIRRNSPRIAERCSMTGASSPGTLIYAGPPLRCEVAPVRAPWYGDNTAKVTLTNLSNAEQVVKVNVRVTGPTRRAHFFEVTKLTLAAGQKREVPVRYLVQRGGRCAVELTIQSIAGAEAQVALRTAPMVFELPALGALLDDAVARIAAAYKAYVLLPEQQRPFDGASRLDMLLARWRYLDSQQQRKASLSADVVMALYARARALADDALRLEAEFQAISE